VIAIPVINQPTELNGMPRALVATKVAVKEVKTRRYQIFGLVYS
jgi:hypothetical protein